MSPGATGRATTRLSIAQSPRCGRDNPGQLTHFHRRIRAIARPMESLIIKLLGFAAATCTTLAYAPQFIKVWKTRSTEDISLGMFLAMMLGVALWLIYGLLSGDAPLVAANAITMLLAGGILVMKLRYG